MNTIKMLKPDAKGRITLGPLATGISSFAVRKEQDKIILEPYVEISLREKWLFNNKVASGQVKKGLEDAAAGRVHKKGSFAKYIKEDKEKDN
jgi:hypothetical protein